MLADKEVPLASADLARRLDVNFNVFHDMPSLGESRS
jgi:hypothetical protein